MIHLNLNEFNISWFLFWRVEIIRLSDKSFKETIKDVELSSYRSTTKEGYVSLDPSKPLPHEYEEGKLSRYNDNVRQKYLSSLDMNDQSNDSMEEHEAKFVSQYANANDSVLLNKTEFREILMSALNINSHLSSEAEKSDRRSRAKTKVSNEVIHQSNSVNSAEIKTSFEHHPPPTDDIVYLNQTIEKPSLPPNDAQRKTGKPISPLDTPEVDKLLNEGKLQANSFLILHAKEIMEHHK